MHWGKFCTACLSASNALDLSSPPLNFFFLLLLKYLYTPLTHAITLITHHLIWPESSSTHRDPWKKMLNYYVAFIVIIVGESGWFVYEPATALFLGNFLTLRCHHCCRLLGPERTLWKMFLIESINEERWPRYVRACMCIYTCTRSRRLFRW
jgi:hypothetical protein